MMPVVAGLKATKKQIVIYSILLFFISTLPYFIGFMGKLYLFSSFILNIIFMALCVILYYDKKNTIAKKTFAYSILYLFLIFLCAMIDKAIMNG